jgi:hypothetical protein
MQCLNHTTILPEIMVHLLVDRKIVESALVPQCDDKVLFLKFNSLEEGTIWGSEEIQDVGAGTLNAVGFGWCLP